MRQNLAKPCFLAADDHYWGFDNIKNLFELPNDDNKTKTCCHTEQCCGLGHFDSDSDQLFILFRIRLFI